MADIELVIKVPEDSYKATCNGCMLPPDVENVVQAIKDGKPFQEVCDRENSEIKNEVKDLSKRVEILEKTIREDKEEQLKKLEAEMAYAKFRCSLPIIPNMVL